MYEVAQATEERIGRETSYPRYFSFSSSMCMYFSSECSLNVDLSQARPRPASVVMFLSIVKRCTSCLFRWIITYCQNAANKQHEDVT